MHATATYDDTRLILQLYEARREERMRKARAWFVSSFRPKTIDEFSALLDVLTGGWFTRASREGNGDDRE